MYDANVFVVKDGGSAVVIDCGARVEDVKKAVGGAKVVAVLLTHGHYDHSEFAEQYAHEFACQVYMHKNAVDTASNVDSAYGEGEYLKNFDYAKLLSGDGTLSLPPFAIEYFSTPGHSHCSMCFKIGDHLFAGDTLFDNGIGRTDLISSSRADMISSLDKLSRITFTIAHSGHGADSDYNRQSRNIALMKRFLSR